MIKLSIIVPVYNVEKYIKECVNSILNQKFQDFELILVNDGSTDSSALICDEYSVKDLRIKVIHKENGGQSSARNRGIYESKGEYIGFVDSDDWIHENMYYKLIKHATDFRSDIVACNLWVMDKNGRFTPYNEKQVDFEYNRDDAMKEVYTNKILTFSPCNKIYCRKLFQDIRFKEGTILEDLDIAYKLIYKSYKVSYLKKCLYYYRYNEHSTLRSKFTIKRLDEYNIRNTMYNFYKEKYPSLSDQVYYDFCKVRSFLFACVLRNKSIDSHKYEYLIEYDIKILNKALINKDLKLRNKLEIFLFMNFPKTEVHIRSLWFTFRQCLLSVKNYIIRS